MSHQFAQFAEISKKVDYFQFSIHLLYNINKRPLMNFMIREK